ncbi:MULTISPECIES: hypothetical protein [Streptosporangium]|uniref:Uncharacterized protein n=1 Tax=Streptosporangium brasiliense TaxID=47480 RepID=A0ABT9RE22_9ACTN|nr:hypothetical protein [Streptosporangium brasiliense]MDP9867513.1 hypothetical protein [Streptosporangium brasiliense]
MKRSLPTVAAVFALALAGAVPAEAATVPDFPVPKIFGTTFQADPGHDFTKRISPRKDGILRGWITHVSTGQVEYTPIKWVKDKYTEGHFVGPSEGHVAAYASPVAKKVVFLSAFGCSADLAGFTVNRQGLGAKRCSRATLLARVKEYRRPSLITVYRGEIVKLQEIYTP